MDHNIQPEYDGRGSYMNIPSWNQNTQLLINDGGNATYTNLVCLPDGSTVQATPFSVCSEQTNFSPLIHPQQLRYNTYVYPPYSGPRVNRFQPYSGTRVNQFQSHSLCENQAQPYSGSYVNQVQSHNPYLNQFQPYSGTCVNPFQPTYNYHQPENVVNQSTRTSNVHIKSESDQDIESASFSPVPVTYGYNECMNQALTKPFVKEENTVLTNPCPLEEGQVFPPVPTLGTVAERLSYIERCLSDRLWGLPLPDSVTHVYNPLQYAQEPHSQFMQKFCDGPKSVLFLGMNPGPFGMAQTGVPFGVVGLVQEWMSISGTVGKPEKENPNRPILGMSCKRKEVSGSRFWGYFQKKCPDPHTFFKHCFIYNYCPLVFMEQSGKNVTPPKIGAKARKILMSACDQALLEVIRLLQVKRVVGIGRFASDCASNALRAADNQDVTVSTIMHPSPANPAANRGWETVVEQQLSDLGLLSLFSQPQADAVQHLQM